MQGNDDKITIREALYCRRVQRKNGTYKEGTRVGIVVKDFETSRNYSSGDIVLYCTDPDSKKELMVMYPLTPDQIDLEISRDSKRTCIEEVRCVLGYMIRDVTIEELKKSPKRKIKKNKD